jgi:hypothetical protein
MRDVPNSLEGYLAENAANDGRLPVLAEVDTGAVLKNLKYLFDRWRSVSLLVGPVRVVGQPLHFESNSRWRQGQVDHSRVYRTQGQG